MALNKRELEDFYRALETPLYNFALRWVFHPALAEDIVHDAFIRVWGRRDEIELATLKSLLYKTVQNLALNEIRKRRVREAVPVLNWLMPVKTPEATLLENEQLVRLRDSLEQLPLNLREVLLLTEFSDMSHAEIARALDIAEGTVGSRRNRALQFLKEGNAHELSTL
jgi:RNA polymerase sigma-70 factor, ECF subfamily